MSGQSAESPGSARQREHGPVAPGEVIDGKYRVLRILGAGGMGVVAAATHVQLGSSVAVKIVRPEVARNREVLARFQREACIAAQPCSDHTIRVGNTVGAVHARRITTEAPPLLSRSPIGAPPPTGTSTALDAETTQTPPVSVTRRMRARCDTRGARPLDGARATDEQWEVAMNRRPGHGMVWGSLQGAAQ
jgi:hypothetical protein